MAAILGKILGLDEVFGHPVAKSEGVISTVHDPRTSLEYAFERDGQSTAAARLEACRRNARLGFINIFPHDVDEGALRTIIERETQYVLPAFNEGENIGTVLRYLRDEHQVSPERITIVDCSADPEDTTAEVAGKFGIVPERQERILAELLDTDKFLDLLRAERIPRGKGLTLTAAHLHLAASGILDRRSDVQHIVCLDADPQDYGIGKYDPVFGFGYIQSKYAAGSIKPAKARRNNQPVYVGENALGIMGEHAKEILDYSGRMQWRLTGEMSRSTRIIPHMVMSTGYPVETLMNMSDAELGVLFMQYADGPLRSDGENSFEKETVMYTQIIRTRLAIEMWNMANILHQHGQEKGSSSPQEMVESMLKKKYKRTVDYSADDVRGVNDILARDIFEYIPDETNIPPKGVEVKDIVESRVVGTIAMLAREGIARIPRFD